MTNKFGLACLACLLCLALAGCWPTGGPKGQPDAPPPA